MITTESECKLAVSKVGGEWRAALSYANGPRGCYKALNDGLIYFNKHPTGASNPTRSPICSNAGDYKCRVLTRIQFRADKI